MIKALYYAVLAAFGFLFPYWLRPFRLFSTPAQSRTPRTTEYRSPTSFTRPPRRRTTECSWRLCPSPGMYAVTSIPFESRTRAIFRIAELGFFGVFVVTLMHTPRLKGAAKKFGRFLIVLKLFVSATDFDFRTKRTRFFRTNWFIVGIVCVPFRELSKVDFFTRRSLEMALLCGLRPTVTHLYL